MVPSAFISLESLPLTPNGKIDRQSLPDPGHARLTDAAEFVPPRNPVEEMIATGWAAILGLERVGIHDNFFQLGGHSLLATQVVSRLRDAFGVEIPLRALFESPTVAGLGLQIESMKQAGARDESKPIEFTPRLGPQPLSYSQEALWFLEQLAPGHPTFNVTAALRIGGSLERSALERSVNELVRRHESLRTSFGSAGGSPHQLVAPNLELSVALIDLSELAADVRLAEAKRLAIAESRRPFDLTAGPLVRVSLIRLDAADHALLLTIHHLVTDGWSFGVAAKELIALYQATRLGRPLPLPAPPIRYVDFAHWQREQLRVGAWTGRIESWRRRLGGLPPLELPTDRPRPPIRSARGAQHSVVLSRELSSAVRALSRNEGVTPFMTLLAAFQVLLGRWSGQEDFAVGSPVANRTRPETERVLGYFVNMLVLRANLAGNPSVREFLQRVRAVSLEAFENQEIPLEVLIPTLKPERDASRAPLFQAMFILQNNALPHVGSLDLTLSPLHIDHGTGTSKFDIALGFEESPDGFAGSVEYNTDLFDAATIARFAERYVKLLEGLVADPERRLSELPLLSERERQQAMAWSHARSRESDRRNHRKQILPAGIHRLFEAQVRATPDWSALVSETETLSYAELNARANRLARHLQARGARADARVGLVLESPIDRIVSILGVLKAGAAYIPIEPTLPPVRLEGMLQAASASIVIVESGELGNALRTRASVVDLEADRMAIAAGGAGDLSVEVDPENLAYVIFTSGTTGRPKGVMISHGSLCSIATAWEHAYHLNEAPFRHLQVAGFGFDVFTGDWVRALVTGGTLVACPRHVALDPRALAELIEREQIECVELVPALAEPLAAHCERSGRNLAGLRLLAVGSDSLPAGLYRRLRTLVGPRGRVINSYGLTEASIDSTYFESPLEERREDGLVPIGVPFPETRTYILDGQCELVPPGVVGEVYVGGPGVARGYVKNPVQTSERFLPDPHGEPGSRMYATGDRGRWREAGVIELLGRRDGQVKVRGFRVELAEVEAAIASIPAVREAAVITQDDGAGGQRLVACVVTDEPRDACVDELRRALRERLPRPMIPTRFEIVPALPRIASGKVDRQALVESLPDQATTPDGLIRPRNQLENDLVVIWEDLLQVRPIGVSDDFFDLGGHSLLAARLAARVEERFGRSLALSDVLKGSTIERLASQLAQPANSRSGPPLIHLGARGAGLPLFLAHPIGGGVLCYNALARRFDGARDVFGLESPGLDSEIRPETDLVRMASTYVDGIRSRRPHGPYILGGWSMGAVVAFEMARQLSDGGQEVPLVVLIDPSAPTQRSAASSTDDRESLMAFAADLARTAGHEPWFSPEELHGLDPVTIGDHGWERAMEHSEIARELGAPRLRRLYEVFRANRLALESYEPRPCSGRVLLIRAGSGPAVFEGQSMGGWRTLALGGVAVHHLVGDHYTIMQEPGVGMLTAIIAGEIQSVETTMREV
jgi:amino acid adenylation domain-containing protein